MATFSAGTAVGALGDFPSLTIGHPLVAHHRHGYAPVEHHAARGVDTHGHEATPEMSTSEGLRRFS